MFLVNNSRTALPTSILMLVLEFLLIYYKMLKRMLRPLKLDFVFSVTRPRYENCAAFDNQK